MTLLTLLTLFRSRRVQLVLALLIAAPYALEWLRHRRAFDWAPLAATARTAARHAARVLRSGDLLMAVGLGVFGALFGAYYATVISHSAGIVSFSTELPGTIPFTSNWSYGQLLAGTGVVSYGLFRVAASWPVAAFCSVMMMTSPLQLYVLHSAPQRDYSRAPFILGVLFGLAILGKGRMSQARVLLAAGIVGLACGFGVQAREELVTFLLPAAVALLLLTPWQAPARIRWKLEGLCVMMFCFVMVAPANAVRFKAIHQSAGFLTPSDGPLGLTPAPYDVGYLFLDEHIEASIDVVGLAATPGRTVGRGSSFLSTYIWYRPADFVARIYGAAHSLLQIPFSYQLKPQGLDGFFINSFYGLRAFVQRLLDGTELLLLASAILILGSRSVRATLVYLLVLFFLSGISTAQFLGRHYFYAECLSYWNLALTLQAGIVLVPSLLRRAPGEYFADRQWRPAIGLTVLVLFTAGLVAPLVLLRQHQSNVLSGLFQGYQAAETDDISVPPRDVDGTIVLTPRPVPITPNAATPGRAEFLVADFGGTGCQSPAVYPVLRYLPAVEGQGVGQRWDWSRSLAVAPPQHGAGRVQLFFPAWDRFSGIELPTTQAACLHSLRRVKDPSRHPILMTALVPSERPLYQRLEALEGDGFYSPAEHARMPGNRQSPDATSSAITWADFEFRAPIVREERGAWVVSGYAQPPVDAQALPRRDRSRSSLASAWTEDVNVAEVDTDLLRGRERTLKKGDWVRVEGELYTGGVTIGLVRAGHSAGASSVTSRGPFVVVLPVPEDGNYVFGLANKVSLFTSIENRLIVHRARHFTAATPVE